MNVIKDTIDFDYAISQIGKNSEINVYLQPNVLNSDNINKTFQEVESTLNMLYEKTRYLEDSIAYTKEFLETRIHHFHNEIDSVLHEIEDISNSSKNLSYISYNVPFVQNTKPILDRDGLTNIYPLVIKNNDLTLDYMIDKKQEFSMWSKISDSIPYKDNLNEVKEQAYRTIYLEEKLMPEGMTETIYVYFKEPTMVNTLNISPVNCKVTNLKFGLINGLEENVGDYTIDMSIETRVCTYIKFDLVCTNYDLNMYTLDKSLITDNLWSKIQEFEFNQITNVATKFDASMIISKTTTNSQTGKKKTITYNSKENKITTNLKMYSYVFGIDAFEIRDSQFYTDGYMISDPIAIGALKEGEYIRLDVKHNKNVNGEIAYSILDGDREIPIAIMEDEWVENELVLGNIDTRFDMDSDSSMLYEKEVIKKNGSIIEASYVDAKQQALNSNDRFSVTYKTSTDFYDYKPLNNTIRIKCYIRTYGNVRNIPYVSNISIRKYGEESLWINRF